MATKLELTGNILEDIDICLPSGLRSVQPASRCNTLDTAKQSGSSPSPALAIWYNFLTAGPGDSDTCHHNLSTMKSLCQGIGAPIKEGKVEGPTTRLTLINSYSFIQSLKNKMYKETTTSYPSLANFPSLAKLFQLAVFFYKG